MRTGRNTLLLISLAALAVAAVLFAGCGGETAEDSGDGIQEGGTFYAATIQDPRSLDPAFLQDSESMQISRQVFDGLLENDPETMELVPAVAKSYQVNEDATVFTFELRDDVMFHNEQECGAEDFVYSWNRVCDPDTNSPVSYHLEPVKGYGEVRSGRAEELEGVKALDDHTLEVTLSYPCADFGYHAAHPVLSPVPREVVEEYGSESFTEHLVGNGPFKFMEWKHEQQVVLDKNGDYYGENQPHLDQVAFKIYPDVGEAYLDFLGGALDDCRLPQTELTAAREQFGEKVIEEPIMLNYFYGFKMNAEPYASSRELRRTFNYAIDREVLSEVEAEGTRRPTTGIVPPGTVGFQEDAGRFYYDPLEAGRLLAEAGFPEGGGLPTLVLSYNTGSGYDNMAQVVQGEVEDIGIDLVVEGYVRDTYVNLIRSEDLTFFGWNLRSDYPIMDGFLKPFLSPSSGGAGNAFGYENPRVDELIIAARRTPDEAERIELYREAEWLILDEAPVIPLVDYTTVWVYSDRVGGYLRTPLEYTPYELVYIRKGSGLEF